MCVLGGGSLFAIHGDCEAYDTRTDRWHMVASMSTRRARVGVAAIGNRLYAVGGWVMAKMLPFDLKLVPHLIVKRYITSFELNLIFIKINKKNDSEWWLCKNE